MEIRTETKVGYLSRDNKYKLLFVYEILMAVLAFISVMFIWSDDFLIRDIDTIIWGIFVIDVFCRFIVSKNKLEYIKKNPLDIVAIIPLDSIFRLARLARLIRLARSLVIIKHYTKPIYQILKTNSLDKVLVFLFVVIFMVSIPIQLLEPSINTYTDAVWWAIVTSTTVGYGDISPETIIGRLIAVFLMIFGIGLLGLVTSSVASYFLKPPIKEENSTVTFLKSEIDRIEDLSDQELQRVISVINSYKKQKNDENM